MAGRPRLPWHSCLLGLLGEAAQAHFGRPDQFRISALENDGQQGIESAVVTGREKDPLKDGVRRPGWNRLRIVAVNSRQPLEMFWIAIEPGNGNPKSFSDEFQRRSGRIGFSGFDGFERSCRKTGGLGQ